MPPESSLGTIDTPKPHILVVDDESYIPKVIQRQFGGTGIPHAFQSATIDHEAAGLLVDPTPTGFSRAKGPRLLITDYRLHGNGRYPDEATLAKIASGEADPSSFSFDGPELIRLARDVEGARGITNRAVTLLLSGGGFDKATLQLLFEQGLLDGFYAKPLARGLPQGILSVLADPPTDTRDERLSLLTDAMKKDLELEKIFLPSESGKISDIVGNFSRRLLQTGSS